MQFPTTWSGFFLVLDGIDGCGKSTQITRLVEYFKKKQIPVYGTAEPSQGDIGKLLRQYLKKNEAPAAVDALLFAADRIEHCANELLPHLEKGELVISDRYKGSSLVYQSIQGKDQQVDLKWMEEINKFSIEPDLTIILDIDPRLTLNRKALANPKLNDNLEKFETITFLDQVREGFLNLAQKASANKVHIIDANQPVDAVFDAILKLLPKKWINMS